MKKIKLFGFLAVVFYCKVALLALILSFKKEENMLNTHYSEYFKGDSIRTGINFFPKEFYNTYRNKPDTPSLKIEMSTTKIYPCFNFPIAISVFKKNKELIIRFDSVSILSSCLTAIGPATSYADVPHDITELVFINGQVIDKYKIDITDTFVTVTPIIRTYTNLTRTKIFRYPKNTFAYICSGNNTRLCDDFANIILDSTRVV